MAFYISGPKLLFETTKISTHPNSTQQESNYIYLYTTKFGTSIKIWLNQKFESTEFETMRVNCIWIHLTGDEANDLPHWRKVYIVVPLTKSQSSYQARFQMHGNSKMPLYCPSQEMKPLFKATFSMQVWPYKWGTTILLWYQDFLFDIHCTCIHVSCM